VTQRGPERNIFARRRIGRVLKSQQLLSLPYADDRKAKGRRFAAGGRTGIEAGTGQLVSQSSGESVSQSARLAKRVDCVSQENADAEKDTQRRNCLGHHLARWLSGPVV
jgi:hypothetical protein